MEHTHTHTHPCPEPFFTEQKHRDTLRLLCWEAETPRGPDREILLFGGDGKETLWHRNNQRHKQSGCHGKEDRISVEAPTWMEAQEGAPPTHPTTCSGPANTQQPRRAVYSREQKHGRGSLWDTDQREGPQLRVETALATQSAPSAQEGDVLKAAVQR